MELTPKMLEGFGVFAEETLANHLWCSTDVP
jgi:hypothetical protein